MPAEFVLPDFSHRCVANLLPSIHATLTGTTPALSVPRAQKYIVLLVDGLGENLLCAFGDHAEWMAAAHDPGAALTCAVPSTTATSLSTLGTGLAPGEHGIVGYTFLDPNRDTLVNALTWQGGPDDVDGFRLVGTHYEQLNHSGHTTAAISLDRFENSSLQQLAFRGTRHFGVMDEADDAHVISLVQQALEQHDVLYLYERRLDHIGHTLGAGSWQWLDMLATIDDFIQRLLGVLPPGVAVLVTGDHGMVNVPVEHRITAEEEPALAGWRHIGGEGRFRQLWTDHPVELLRRWRDVLGERAEVRTRQEAIDDGWFGPVVQPAAAARMGDVLVAMRSDWAVMSTTFPKEFGLVGMHGSLTAEEMLVPLLSYGGTPSGGGGRA